MTAKTKTQTATVTVEQMLEEVKRLQGIAAQLTAAQELADRGAKAAPTPPKTGKTPTAKAKAPAKKAAPAAKPAKGASTIDAIEPLFQSGEQITKLDRITVDPRRMNGQPTIRNLRLTVRRVIELLALYSDRGELRREYPELEDEDIRQSLLFAATSIEDRMVEFSL